MAERVSPADGTRQFLVRWEGYTEADDTWEPAENLLDPQVTLALNPNPNPNPNPNLLDLQLLEEWGGKQRAAEAAAAEEERERRRAERRRRRRQQQQQQQRQSLVHLLAMS